MRGHPQREGLLGHRDAWSPQGGTYRGRRGQAVPGAGPVPSGAERGPGARCHRAASRAAGRGSPSGGGGTGHRYREPGTAPGNAHGHREQTTGPTPRKRRRVLRFGTKAPPFSIPDVTPGTAWVSPPSPAPRSPQRRGPPRRLPGPPGPISIPRPRLVPGYRSAHHPHLPPNSAHEVPPTSLPGTQSCSPVALFPSLTPGRPCSFISPHPWYSGTPISMPGAHTFPSLVPQEPNHP